MILIIIFAYFLVLMLVSRWSSLKSDNDTFYRGNRKSPWYMVAFGMIGASISGVTFVSVPGMVLHSDMTYLQMCLGFIVGYILVATVLLPVYYRLNLTTIYSYLQRRIGMFSYKTGAVFFIISKLVGASLRFFVVCILLQRFVLDAYGVPFLLTASVMVFLIWLYTRRGGIKTLVWTDALQTLCMFAALVIIIMQVADRLDFSVTDAVSAISSSPQSRIFIMDDWMSRQNFWKQFFSGMFVVVVMTGLDQDMMQKNLTCRNLRDAQKDMISYGFAFVPANLLFLSLGVLLTILAAQQGIALPQIADELVPMFAATNRLGSLALFLFSLGIVAACFSSADSALTALTTTTCIDIFGKESDEGLRKRVHGVMSAFFVICMLIYEHIQSSSMIDAIYTVCGYTYGPLLGMFAFGLFTSRRVIDCVVPFIACLSPLLCYALSVTVEHVWGYRFGYELLMLNGLITFVGLWMAKDRGATSCIQTHRSSSSMG